MYNRDEIVRELREERLIGYLDPGAEAYLFKINGPHLMTTSSCTGRITIVEGRWPWLRDGARIVYKSHQPITLVQLASVMARPFEHLWLKVTGPILHVATDSLRCGSLLLRAARGAGFKHSGIMSLGEDRYVIELLSAVQVSAPLRLGGLDVVGPSTLERLASLSNEALREGWRRLTALANSISGLC